MVEFQWPGRLEKSLLPEKVLAKGVKFADAPGVAIRCCVACHRIAANSKEAGLLRVMIIDDSNFYVMTEHGQPKRRIPCINFEHAYTTPCDKTRGQSNSRILLLKIKGEPDLLLREADSRQVREMNGQSTPRQEFGQILGKLNAVRQANGGGELPTTELEKLEQVMEKTSKEERAKRSGALSVEQQILQAQAEAQGDHAQAQLSVERAAAAGTLVVPAAADPVSPLTDPRASVASGKPPPPPGLPPGKLPQSVTQEHLRDPSAAAAGTAAAAAPAGQQPHPDRLSRSPLPTGLTRHPVPGASAEPPVMAANEAEAHAKLTLYIEQLQAERELTELQVESRRRELQAITESSAAWTQQLQQQQKLAEDHQTQFNAYLQNAQSQYQEYIQALYQQNRQASEARVEYHQSCNKQNEEMWRQLTARLMPDEDEGDDTDSDDDDFVLAKPGGAPKSSLPQKAGGSVGASGAARATDVKIAVKVQDTSGVFSFSVSDAFWKGLNEQIETIAGFSDHPLCSVGKNDESPLLVNEAYLSYYAATWAESEPHCVSVWESGTWNFVNSRTFWATRKPNSPNQIADLQPKPQRGLTRMAAPLAAAVPARHQPPPQPPSSSVPQAVAMPHSPEVRSQLIAAAAMSPASLQQSPPRAPPPAAADDLPPPLEFVPSPNRLRASPHSPAASGSRGYYGGGL